MKPGECWYINVNYRHSVHNYGEIDRTHLVIDVERNDWTDELFFSLTQMEELLVSAQPTEYFSRETLIKLIDRLEKMNEPASIKLVRNLKQQLADLPDL
jgi:aspartyl/asparaginyl beta-hydroxylase (cupin superfamily)